MVLSLILFRGHKLNLNVLLLDMSEFRVGGIF